MKRYNLTQIALLVLLIVLYVLAFREIILNLNNEKVLLQGDDMGGFLRDIALLSKYWFLEPVIAHKDQLFPSIFNIVGAIVYLVSRNLMLAYLSIAAILMIAGIIGFNELLSLFKIDFRARYLGLILYVYNPAIASMFFSGELHIVTTYFGIPYIVLLILTPFRAKVSYRYVAYSLMVLLGLPYYHFAFLLQSSVIIVLFSLIIIVLDRIVSLSKFKYNVATMKTLLKIVVSSSLILLTIVLKYNHMVLHNPFKLYVTYSIYDYKKHSLRNLFEALTLRPLDISFNYYFQQSFLYNLSFWITMILLTTLTVVAILLAHSKKFSLKREYKVILLATLISILASVILGLGPNNPDFISTIFIYLFVHFHIFNLLKMGYRFVLIEVFFYAILASIIVHVLSFARNEKSKRIDIRQLTAIFIVLLIILSSIFVSVEKYNNTVFVPNEWTDMINYLSSRKDNIVYVVPSYPYTVLLSKNPSRKDVGSLNYLATWLELHRNIVVYSNYYLMNFLQSLLLNTGESEFYPKVLLNVLRNINIDYIVVSKSIYPVTKLKIFKNEANIVYQYIQNMESYENNMNESSVKRIDKFDNTILSRLGDDKSLIYSANTFAIAYPTNYEELGVMINYFPRLPFVLGSKHVDDALIKKVLNALSVKEYNVNVYLLISKNAIPLLLLSLLNDKILLQHEHKCLKILSEFFIPLCKTKSSILDVSSTIINRLNKYDYHNGNIKGVLIFVPIYTLTKSKIYIRYNHMNYTIESKSDGLKWLIFDIDATALYYYPRIHIEIFAKSWFAIGSAYVTSYNDVYDVYHFLTYLVKSHKLYPILIQDNLESLTLENIFIIGIPKRKAYDIVKLLANIEDTLINYRIASIRTLTLTINNNVKFNSVTDHGFINIILLRHVRKITINITAAIYKKGFIVSLGETYSILYIKHGKELITILRKLKNNTWTKVTSCVFPSVSNATISSSIHYSSNQLEIKVNNKLCTRIVNIQRPLEHNNIYLGVYSGALLNITSFKLNIDNFRLSLSEYSRTNRYKYILSRIEFLRSMNASIKQVPTNVKSLRVLFKYSYILPANTHNLFVIYEPYTYAWQGSNCIIMPGLFGSYMIILRSNDSYCSVSYRGFIFIDLYLIALLLALGVLAFLHIRKERLMRG